jgi:pimeloyl-ACP methyl ester carboxylesterase
MKLQTPDGVTLHTEVTGAGPTALVFVHGWLGSGRWWDAQRDAFSADFTVAQVDLAGHGASGDREDRSIQAHARDLEAIAAQLDAKHVVLIGHSMSGATVCVAAPRIARLSRVVLVDTLKNVDQPMTLEQAKPMLELYRKDFRRGVLEVLPKFLYGPKTPREVIDRLNTEFLRVPGERAAAILEPLYRCDLQQAVRGVTVPVRAINSDQPPTNVEGNRRWFQDYDVELLEGLGHYPMLEAPEAFNAAGLQRGTAKSPHLKVRHRRQRLLCVVVRLVETRSLPRGDHAVVQPCGRCGVGSSLFRVHPSEACSRR